mmetsp:Transcript_4048/g.10100  ORF Transcript_4048/g.10100 Transcript_4048/m.10100 type:complete len:86 (-) Transcript_4048:506-763(-)
MAATAALVLALIALMDHLTQCLPPYKPCTEGVRVRALAARTELPERAHHSAARGPGPTQAPLATCAPTAATVACRDPPCTVQPWH